jgi:energy-coupling factor transport system permease protein
MASPAVRCRLAMTRTARALHPVAWWLWAIGLAAAASRTTNPLLLALVLAVLGYVISARRSDAPWARAFKYYLALAGITIAIRVVFRAVFTTGAVPADHVLFRLPVIPTPHWYAGVQIGGAVSLEGTLSAATDGMRLAALLCCIGAANTLANPKRALRVLPGAVYELGVAVTVALSVAPQLVESLLRVRKARRLRGARPSRPGHLRRFRGLRSLLVPVLQDALARSLLLAAAMDSRGYGRFGTTGKRTRRITAALLLGGLLGLCAGAYGLLDAGAPRLLGLPAILAGAAVCCAGLALGSRRVKRTSYRPDRWSWPEWVTVGCAIVPAAVLFSSDSGLNPSFAPLAWPPLPITAAIAIVIAAIPGIAAPPVPTAGPAVAAPVAVADPVRPKVAA